MHTPHISICTARAAMRFAVLAQLLLCPLLTACAINDRGLILRRDYQNASFHLTELRAVGLILSADPLDRSLTLGTSRRWLLFTRTNPTSLEPLEPIACPHTDTSVNPDPFLLSPSPPPPLSQLGHPIAIHTESLGLRLEHNALATGLHGGLLQRTVLLAAAARAPPIDCARAVPTPAHPPGLFVLSVNTRHPEVARAIAATSARARIAPDSTSTTTSTSIPTAAPQPTSPRSPKLPPTHKEHPHEPH